MNENQTRRIRPIRILASYVMDAPNVSSVYSDELHECAAVAGRAIANAGENVQVWFVDAARLPGSAEELVDQADGVLILGGVDVDPELYTSDPEARARADVADLNRPADDNESALVKRAIAAGAPVLGICRGAQLLNVALGGTLIPDLGDGTMHNTRPDRDGMTDHEIEFDASSRLARIYGRGRARIRSAHHQAIERPAPGLRVAARAGDGVVEAVEADDARWIVGVQWHPEDPGGDAGDLERLVGAFVDAARATSEAAR